MKIEEMRNTFLISTLKSFSINTWYYVMIIWLCFACYIHFDNVMIDEHQQINCFKPYYSLDTNYSKAFRHRPSVQQRRLQWLLYLSLSQYLYIESQVQKHLESVFAIYCVSRVFAKEIEFQTW